MTVYSYPTMAALSNALSDVASGFFSRMPLILTPDEYISAFIQPDHVSKLREMEQLVGFTGSLGSYATIESAAGNRGEVTVNFGGRPPVILPQYVRYGMQPTCPDDVRMKIEAWFDERIKLGAAFGDAYDALRYLNEYCDRAETMALLLPCFPYLLSKTTAGTEKQEQRKLKRAQALQSKKSVGRMPKIPRHVKDRMQEVSSVVSSFSLMEDSPVPTADKGYALIHLRATRGPRAKSIFGGDVTATIL